MADQQKSKTQNFPTITSATYFQELPEHSPGYLGKTPEAVIAFVQSLFAGYSETDPSLISLKNLTAGGGTYTCWKVSNKSDPSMNNWFTSNPELVPSTPAIVIHARNEIQGPDHRMMPKMLALQRCMFDADLATPVLCSGTHWWVEPFIEDDQDYENGDKASILEYAKLIARIHMLPTDWYKKFRDYAKGMYPLLKNASDGSLIWTFFSKPIDWVSQGWIIEDCQKFALNCDREPNSTAGKRIVSCHMDFHPGNIIRNKDLGKHFIIDFEYSCVSYAAHDLAFVFWWIWRKGKKDLGQDWWKDFLRTYLETLGLPATDFEIEKLKLDILYGQQRCLHGLVREEVDRKRICPTYDFGIWRECAKFMDELCGNEELRLRVNRECLEDVLAGSEDYQKAKGPIEAEFQRVMLRRMMTIEEEEKMIAEAKLKGVVRIETTKFMAYDEAEEFAKKEAGGFCTIEELKASGVNSGTIDMWMYVRNPDAPEDAVKDVAQLGKWPDHERYFSHFHKWGKASWLNSGEWTSWRPLNFLYVKAKTQD